MQATHDIFGIWSTWADLARDLNVNPERVWKWKQYHRIPEEYWQSMIAVAVRKKKPLTIEQLFAFNTPRAARNRPVEARA